MINKLFKPINNKFSRFFKFLFFLRYLFLIFFVATSLFFLIPKFFDYEKKEKILKDYLLNQYDFKIENFQSIKFKVFPLPHLEITNLKKNFYLKNINLKTQKLKIFPKLISLYDYENFQSNKIKLENIFAETDKNNIKLLFEKIIKSKNKIYLKNFNLKIKDNANEILDIKKASIKNYGYDKNIIRGEVFEQKFKLSVKDNLRYIDFKLLDTGVSAKINFELVNNNFSEGNIKGKVLKSNFYIDFKSDNKSITIKNFIFRDKNLSFDSQGLLIFKPFLEINLNSEIKNFNPAILRNLDINTILNLKEFYRKFNSQNKIIHRTNKFSRKIINYFQIDTRIAYGRLNFKKKMILSKSVSLCDGKINLLEEFPILYFDCSINSPNKKKLLKKFKIDIKSKDETFDLEVKGRINILRKIINFDVITVNQNQKAKEEDLKYFKSSFERIFFEKKFLEMFEISKIRKFILDLI